MLCDGQYNTYSYYGWYFIINDGRRIKIKIAARQAQDQSCNASRRGAPVCREACYGALMVSDVFECRKRPGPGPGRTGEGCQYVHVALRSTEQGSRITEYAGMPRSSGNRFKSFTWDPSGTMKSRSLRVPVPI